MIQASPQGDPRVTTLGRTARPSDRLAGRVRSILPHVLLSVPGASPMPRAFLAAALFSTLAASASAQDAKPADPAPLQLTAQQDHKLMMEALKIKSPAAGRQRHEPQRAERRQLRRVEGQPLPEPARPPDPEERREGHDRRAVVEQAAAGDRRGLRPRGLRPRPQGRAQGDVGGDRDDRGEGRRRAGRHQEAGRATSTTRSARRSRSTSSSR